MHSLSSGRNLRANSVLAELVTLAVLLTAVATPAASSSVHATGGHRSRPASVAHLPQIAPADTDSTLAVVAVAPTPHRRGGYVVTEDQLVEEQDFSLASVLVAHFPGIRVVHSPDADRVASGLHLNMTGAPCFLQVFVDGVYIVNGSVDWVSVRNLASIEYRTPGNIPVQFQNRLPGAMCGALLLWSKYS